MKNKPLRSFQTDQLTVEIYPDRAAMGAAAAADAAKAIKDLLAKEKTVRMIFAAAPSQNEFLASLGATPGIDWSRISAFHLDDYLGLPEEAPQRFSSFLKEHLFNRVRPGAVHYLIGPASGLTRKADPASLADEIEESCREYSLLLQEEPIDIVCMGIGENGHLAFNDPPVADFNESQWVKLVRLDERCRQQQVNDGCFATLAEVPTHALTLTIPALIAAKRIFCMVPGPTKQEAVSRTLADPVATQCPATILRRHPAATLYLDPDAAARIR